MFFLQNFYKIEKKQHEIMFDTFSLYTIDNLKTAIEKWAQEMNGSPGNELGAQRVPHPC